MISSSTNNAQKEIATNVELLNRAITAVDNLSKNLKFVVLPTGTKVHLHSLRASCVDTALTASPGLWRAFDRRIPVRRLSSVV